MGTLLTPRSDQTGEERRSAPSECHSNAESDPTTLNESATDVISAGQLEANQAQQQANLSGNQLAMENITITYSGVDGAQLGTKSAGNLGLSGDYGTKFGLTNLDATFEPQTVHPTSQNTYSNAFVSVPPSPGTWAVNEYTNNMSMGQYNIQNTPDYFPTRYHSGITPGNYDNNFAQLGLMLGQRHFNNGFQHFPQVSGSRLSYLMLRLIRERNNTQAHTETFGMVVHHPWDLVIHTMARCHISSRNQQLSQTPTTSTYSQDPSHQFSKSTMCQPKEEQKRTTAALPTHAPRYDNLFTKPQELVTSAGWSCCSK